MKHATDILVISLTGIGNTLLFTPALERLVERFPDATVDFLVEGEPSREIIATNPHVNQVYNLQAAEKGLGCLNLVRRLRGARYDRSYTTFPSNRPRFNIFTWVVGARERVIHSYPDSPVPTATFLQTVTVPAVNGEHDIMQNCRLALEGDTGGSVGDGLLPRPVLHLTEGDKRFAERWMKRVGDSGPLIALHPGSSSGRFHMQSAKRWPVDRFAETARRLQRGMDATVLVMCGPDEKELRPVFREVSEGSLFFPEGEIREISGILGEVDLLVTNDSGLMHIATALNTPVVALFGPTNVNRTAPVWDNCCVVRGNGCDNRTCFRYPLESTWSGISCDSFDCWDGLTPERVVKIVSEKLRKD